MYSKKCLARVVVFAFLLIFAAPVRWSDGEMITVDADSFSDGVNISAVFGDVLLSSVGGYSGLDGNVYASSDGLASMGFNVFANNLSFAGQWYADIVDGFSFRADFSGAANYAAIDIIGDNGSDYGVMQAFDSGGQLLGTVVSPELSYGQVFRAEFPSGSFDIAYIIAGGDSTEATTVHLDNLAFNIPEPSTFVLLGLAGVMVRRKRLNSN